MKIKRRVLNILNLFLKRYNYYLLHSNLLEEWQKTLQDSPRYKESSLPSGADIYLNKDNNRLIELQQLYLKVNSMVTDHILWKDDHVREVDIKYFRGDNAYVWQLKGLNMRAINYALTTYYIKSIDKLGLLEKLEEDDYFGNIAFFVDKKTISRDLLDSIIELYFLERHLNISSNDLTILDIGAGYGRLAHRTLEAFRHITTYLSTDAVAISTFISEYYLRFRKLENRARVIPLNEIEDALKKWNVDVALNIHSFSECRIISVDWWLSLLKKYGIKYLMIVPNPEDHEGKLLLSFDRQNINPVIEKHGYKLIAKEPKYEDPIVQQFAISPTHHYLFKLYECEAMVGEENEIV